MKKLILIFLLIFSFTSYSSPKDRAYISSFNVLRLGEAKKNYKELSKIITMLDLVGLVEVQNREGLETLVDALEKHTHEKWGYHISPYPVGSKKYKEYYAYVWKKDKVKFVKSNGFYKEKYNEFIREPYGATFKIGNFDFTFILLHAIYGKHKDDRVLEAMQLANVYDYFQNQDKHEQDILIGGDFNLSVRNEGFKKLLNHKDNIINTISPNMKTTIGTKGFANQYDNIFLSKKYTREYTGNSGGIDTTNGDYKYTRKYISDHIPVFIEVDISLKDDD